MVKKYWSNAWSTVGLCCLTVHHNQMQASYCTYKHRVWWVMKSPSLDYSSPILIDSKSNRFQWFILEIPIKEHAITWKFTDMYMRNYKVVNRRLCIVSWARNSNNVGPWFSNPKGLNDRSHCRWDNLIIIFEIGRLKRPIPWRSSRKLNPTWSPSGPLALVSSNQQHAPYLGVIQLVFWGNIQKTPKGASSLPCSLLVYVPFFMKWKPPLLFARELALVVNEVNLLVSYVVLI